MRHDAHNGTAFEQEPTLTLHQREVFDSRLAAYESDNNPGSSRKGFKSRITRNRPRLPRSPKR